VIAQPSPAATDGTVVQFGEPSRTRH